MRLEYGNGAITIRSHADPAPISRPNVFVGDRHRRWFPRYGRPTFP